MAGGANAPPRRPALVEEREHEWARPAGGKHPTTTSCPLDVRALARYLPSMTAIVARLHTIRMTVPSFFEGMARAFDLFGVLAPAVRFDEDPAAADKAATKADWEATRQDLLQALKP